MPRSAAITIEGNFSRGLITEATAMNYPENSVVSTDNCVYTKVGKVIRRYGIDYETNYAISNFSTMGVMASAGTPSDYYNSIVTVEYNWITVNQTGTISFIVQQLGDVIVFFSVDADNNISGNRKSFTIDLDTFQVGNPVGDVGQYLAAKECSFTSGFGYLFVTHPLCEPFYVEYNPNTDSITSTAISVKIRDFERLDDGLAIDERPNSLTDTHEYNLFNQGWYQTARLSGGSTGNVLTAWDAAFTSFPANTEYWWLYKNSSNQFDTAEVDKWAMGNTPAPNGHYIYSAFASDRSNADAAIGTVVEYSSGDNRPASNAFYAGRVWYAGVDATGFSNKIYFSQIVDSPEDFGKCYQAADPTSEFDSDLLPNDGGVISIPDIANVIKLVTVKDSLFVFCTNGIWKISGPSGVFTANDYSVSQVSTVSAKAKNSIVLVEGAPIWWDTAGIYTVQFDATSGLENVVNVSEPTIQRVIDNIPNSNLPYVKGVYNTVHKTAHFIYRSTTASTLTESYEYDKLLVLSVIGQSFSTHTISDGTPKVTGLLYPNFSNNDALITKEQASIVKFVTIGAIGTAGVMAYTASQFNNPSYLDWKTFDGVGVDYDSEFITGYRIRGELLKKFQSNYIVAIMETEDNASAFLQGVWDYSTSPQTGRFTTSQQIYRSNPTASYSRTKRRIRGSGYSLQLKFYSETGKPFTIVGWATFDTGNNVP